MNVRFFNNNCKNNGYMLNQQRKRVSNGQYQNKQNLLGRSSSSIDGLNYKINKSTIGLIEKDYNATDERVKILMNHKEQLSRIRQAQDIKHKQETASMLKRAIALENTITQLEQSKIENQQQIDYLKEKLTITSEKFMNEIQKLKAELKQLEKFGVDNSNTILLEENIKELLEQNRKIKKQLIQQNLKSQKLAMSLSKKQNQLKSSLQMQKTLRQNDNYQNQKQQLQKQLQSTRCLWNEDIKKFQIQIGAFETIKSALMIQNDEKILKFEGKIKYLINQITLKQNKIKQLEGICSNFKNKYECSQSSKLSIISEYQKSQKIMDETIKKLGQQLLSKTQKIKQFEKQQAKQKSEKKLKQNELKYEEQINQLTKQIEHQKQITASLQQNLTKWQQQCKKVGESRDTIQAQLLKLKLQTTKIRQIQNQATNNKQNYQRTIQQLKNKNLINLTQFESIIRQKNANIQNLEQVVKQTKACLRITREQLNNQKQKNLNFQNLQQIVKQTKACLQTTREQLVNEKQKNLSIQNLQQIIKQTKISLQISQEQLNNQKLKNQQILQELQHNRDKYQKALQIETAKSNELSQLIDRLKQKFQHDQIINRSELQKQIQTLSEKLDYFEAQTDKYKKQVLNLKQSINVKQRQFQRKTRVLEDQKDFLELEVKKWKQYRNQTSNQFEQLRKENRKMRVCLEEKQEEILKFNIKVQSANELQLKCRQLQQEKILSTQKNQSQISEIKKKYEEKLDQITRQNQLLQEKIKAKVQSQLHSSHKEEIAKIRRKSEDNTFTINRYQQKVEDLSTALEETQRSHKIVIEKMKKQIERKQTQIMSNNIKNEEIKKKMQIYREQIEDLEKKCREKDIKNEQLSNKLKKTENSNVKYEYELQQIQNSLKQIQREKWILEQKRKNVQRQGGKLQSEKYELQNELKSAHKLIKQCQGQLDQHLESNRKKNAEILELKELNQKIKNEGKLYKQKILSLQVKRDQVYKRISNISNQHFQIQVKENELQFLMVLCQKIKGYIEVKQRLESDRNHMKKQIKAQSEQFMRSVNKNTQFDANLKENYDILYKKYLKYKDAYIHCKTRLERHRLEVINDQKFTEEIISHCITLIPRMQ